MQTLTKKTTILFSPDIYNQLEEMAKTLKTSVAELIRRAIVKQYLFPSKEQRLKSVEHLSNIGGSVSDWETMEKEIMKDTLGDI